MHRNRALVDSHDHDNGGEDPWYVETRVLNRQGGGTRHSDIVLNPGVFRVFGLDQGINPKPDSNTVLPMCMEELR